MADVGEGHAQDSAPALGNLESVLFICCSLGGVQYIFVVGSFYYRSGFAVVQVFGMNRGNIAVFSCYMGDIKDVLCIFIAQQYGGLAMLEVFRSSYFR